MKSFLMIATLLVSPATLAYTVVRNTTLDADGVNELTIRTYSGPLSIAGTDGDRIEVEVVIDFADEWEKEEADQAIEDGLEFNLERRGRRAHLDSWVGDYDDDDVSFFTWGLIDLFRGGRFSGKERPFSHLEVKVPRGVDLEINDFRGDVIIARVTGDIRLRTGAGPVEITDITGDLDLQDGSGDITLVRISGDVEVRDGSGDLDASTIGGRLVIHDGSGNIVVRDIGDNLDIRDGSGNIRIADLKKDAEIYDGSGNIDVRQVAGTLTLTDGSGGIDVNGVDEDVVVFSRGSGAFDVRNVKGNVIDSAERRGSRRERFSDNYRYNYDYRDRDRDIDIDIDEDVDVDIDIDIDRDNERRR